MLTGAVSASKPFLRRGEQKSTECFSFALQPPFTADDRKRTMDKIIKGKLVLPAYLTLDARELIRSVSATSSIDSRGTTSLRSNGGIGTRHCQLFISVIAPTSEPSTWQRARGCGSDQSNSPAANLPTPEPFSPCVEPLFLPASELVRSLRQTIRSSTQARAQR